MITPTWFRSLAMVAASGALVACGSAGGGGGGGRPDGADTAMPPPPEIDAASVDDPPAPMPASPQDLVGDWSVTYLLGVCTATAHFGSDGAYALSRTCTQDSVVSVDSEEGTYAAVVGRVDFAVVTSSCPDAPMMFSMVAETTSDGSLVLRSDTSTTVYARAAAPGAPDPSATFGCFRMVFNSR